MEEARQRNQTGTYVFLVWICWRMLLWIAPGFVSERAR